MVQGMSFSDKDLYEYDPQEAREERDRELETEEDILDELMKHRCILVCLVCLRCEKCGCMCRYKYD